MKTYTAKELSEIIQSEGEGELTTRTIKYYTQMGWMPELETVGNKRVYTDKHLDYLRAMRILTKTGKKLADAADELRGMNESEIKKIGNKLGYFSSNSMYELATSEVFQPAEGLSVSFSEAFDPFVKNEIKEEIKKILSKKNKGE